jgi:membrane-bound lytic murein transglycosylase A
MKLRQYACALARIATMVVVAGCAVTTTAPSPEITCPQCPSCPQSGAGSPVAPTAKPLQRANWEDLPGWREDDLRDAWGAFLHSCSVLRNQAQWAPICADSLRSRTLESAGIRAFLEQRFVPYRLVNPDQSQEGLVTGYYEPLVKGSRRRGGSYVHPLYGVPDDILVIDLGEVYPELKHLRLRGRVDGRRVVPYYSRAELAQRETQLASKVLFWISDPVGLFFLQVQGSGRIELDNGTRVRVGYAEHNGHPYQSIGRWLSDRGALKPEQASMPAIKAWAKANPRRLNELLNANPSFVFFRELADGSGGPVGALGVPLTEGRSVAVDPRVVPLGAPVFLATTWPGSARQLNRLMVAQDSGGAIKGAVRADFYWGFGPNAGALAGEMRQRGSMWVLLPQNWPEPQ